MSSSNPDRRKRRNRGSQSSDPDLCIRCMTSQNIADEVWGNSRSHLYSKYCSSQNFYWMKDVNDFLEGTYVVDQPRYFYGEHRAHEGLHVPGPAR